MPKQTPDLPLPSIRLDATAELPLHRQLYEQLRTAIRSGHLKPGTRLPSTRALARDLGVSRTTTLEAYRDLRAEGYLEAHIGAGTVVVQKLPELFLQTKTGESSSEIHHREKSQEFPERPPIRLSQWGMRF